MATNGRRRVLLRSLPVVLLLVLALAGVPQRSPASPRATVACSAVRVEESPAQTDPATTSAVDAEPAPGDFTTALSAQFTAGVRGSRAPPAASA
jgi:hypothetical protein